jgi:hypothetical protein
VGDSSEPGLPRLRRNVASDNIAVGDEIVVATSGRNSHIATFDGDLALAETMPASKTFNHRRDTDFEANSLSSRRPLDTMAFPEDPILFAAMAARPAEELTQRTILE